MPSPRPMMHNATDNVGSQRSTHSGSTDAATAGPVIGAPRIVNGAKSPALFLDRDGTIIYDKDYLADPAGVELIPGAREALHGARARGYRLFLFTNQSGIGRGYYTLDDVHACNRRMLELLDLGPELFTEICIAPEAHSEPAESPRADASYRKPSPRFILEMIEKYALAPEQCWMVGDRESDIEAGLRAGIHSAAVATGKYSLDEWRARLPAAATLHADLLAFVNHLAPRGLRPAFLGGESLPRRQQRDR